MPYSDVRNEYGVALKEYRELLVTQHYSDSVNFDKALTTLSGGALGLSITFYNQIVTTPTPSASFLLFLSWIGFGLSLITNLLSYLTAMKGRQDYISQIDAELNGEGFGPWKTYNLTNHLNYSSVFLLILGITLFISYVFVNLN